MLGVDPRPNSGSGIICPWIEYGEPIKEEEAAERPDTVELLEEARIFGVHILY